MGKNNRNEQKWRRGRNLRKIPRRDYNESKRQKNIYPRKKRDDGDINGSVWLELNKLAEREEEWVSATSVKNYMMKDPCLDWIKLYYKKKIVK